MSNIITSKNKSHIIEEFGMSWDTRHWNELDRNLYCYVHDTREEGEGGRLTKWDHFKRSVDIIWNEHPRSTRKVIWNDWSESMQRAMIYNNYASLAGCASSGKSDCMAVYGLVNYMAHPTKTKVLMSSTTIKMAHLRIWRSVNELWRKDLPGRMVYSKCLIKGQLSDGELGEDTGVSLIPAAGAANQEIDSNFMGLKQDRMIVLLDELTEIPVSVLNACYANLSNNKHFEMKAASNPNEYHDAFGIFSKPKKGWASVTEDDYSWETARGICVRYDSERSPNMKAGKVIYPWLPKAESIAQAKLDFGERSRHFYRMFKAMWFSGASDETIYSEGEVIKALADTPIDEDEIDLGSEQVVVMAGDPAFTQGGDRFPLVKGRVVVVNKKKILEVTEVSIIKDDITAAAPNRSYAAVDHIKKKCTADNVYPSHFAFDSTGAGIPFRDILVATWSSLPMAVNFGGAPSTMQISPIDKRIATDVYFNRVSEIWVRMKGLMREGRIRGLTPEIIRELVERRWHGTSGRLLRVESKVDMKARTGMSPDIVDALMVLVELCVKLGLMGEMEMVEVDKRSSAAWQRSIDMHDIEYGSDQDLEW